MTHTVGQLMNASNGRNATLRFEKVNLSIMIQRFSDFYQRIADREADSLSLRTTRSMFRRFGLIG